MNHTAESLQQAFRYLFASEVKALKELARSLPKNPRVINIGAGAGTSALAFMESRHDIFVTTIDIQKDDSPLGSLDTEMLVIESAGYGNVPNMIPRYTQIHGNSAIAGNEFRETDFRTIDMVFIDGDHSYEGCKSDILAWLPNIKPGGIMAIHDYNKEYVFREGPIENAPHPASWAGIDKAVREFLLCKYEVICQVDTLIAFIIK